MDTLSSKQFCKISSAFINSAFRDQQFYDAYVALSEMTENNPTLERNGGTSYLKSILRENLSSDFKEYYFPGPMAVQLSRNSLKKLQEHDYFITEKSDGIRAMCLMLHIKDFPRWVLEDDSTSQFGLLDNCAIECTYHHAKMQENDTVTFQLSCMENTHLQYRRRTNSVQLVNTATNTSQSLKRLKGWSFSFFFDRTYEFYLSLEEIAFPAREIISRGVKKVEDVKFQEIVILDGEIVYNLKEKRNNYSVYDLITCVKEKIISLRTESMGKRYELINRLITDPHYYYYKEVLKRDPPSCLKLIRKHFYKKSELMKVLDCIKEDPVTGEYLYKEYNKNDGLVFTPDDPNLSAFKSGANDYLVKWKWPNKLTCDFLVCPTENTTIVEGATSKNENQFHFYYQFNSNRKVESAYFSQIQVKYISPDLCKKFSELQSNSALIAECGYDRNGWYFLLIREDKNTPNAFKTIANTLENMIENITVEDLKQYVLSPKESNIEEFQRTQKSRENFLIEYKEQVFKSNAFVYFKLAHQNQQLTLHYFIHSYQDNTEKWRGHCLAEVDSDCRIDLTSIRNRDEQLVKAYFHPFEGKYKIVELVGQKYMANCSGSTLLNQLLKMDSVKNSIPIKKVGVKRDEYPHHYNGSSSNGNNGNDIEPINHQIINV